MKLYTFQPLFVYQCLVELGYYHPFLLFENDQFLKEEISTENYQWSFIKSYEWLREQMLQKGVEFSINNEHMIWAWQRWAGSKMVKPDKRYTSVFNYFSKPYVLMELDIPSERVCLSDYHAWHSVLNYWLLDEDSKVDQFKEKFNFYTEKPLSDPHAHKQLCASWQNIFDFEKSRKLLELAPEEQAVQATFFELFYTDVTKVHFFENKKCTKILNVRHKN